MLYSGCFQCCTCWSLSETPTETLTPIQALKSLRDQSPTHNGQRGKVVRCMKAISHLRLTTWTQIANCPIEQFRSQKNFGEASHQVLAKVARQNGITLPAWSGGE